MKENPLDLMLALGFMAFGIGLLVFVMLLTTRDEDVRYARKLNEAREFGLGPRVRRHFGRRS